MQKAMRTLVFNFPTYITIALLVTIFLQIYVFQIHTIHGSSMEPTLPNTRVVFMSRIQHTLGNTYNDGDIVIIDSRIDRRRVFRDDFIEAFSANIIITKLFKIDNQYQWIKRIIGKQGDNLLFENGKVFRNGVPLKEPYLKDANTRFQNVDKVLVPENFYYVMGDNRNGSIDSRFIGCIPDGNVIGKYIGKTPSW